MTASLNPLAYLNNQVPDPCNVIVQTRAPRTSDKGNLGDLWVNRLLGNVYSLSAISATAYTWTLFSGSSLLVASVAASSGTATPSSGVITIVGGTNLTSSASGSTVTIDMDANLAALTTVTSNRVSTKEFLVDYTTDAASAISGSVVLSGGTATVTTTAALTGSLIFLTNIKLGTVAVAKALAVTTITSGTSFVITSADATDTSTVAWFIINSVTF